MRSKNGGTKAWHHSRTDLKIRCSHQHNTDLAKIKMRNNTQTTKPSNQPYTSFTIGIKRTSETEQRKKQT